MPKSGTFTFLFTDIEGSTRLLRELKGEYETVLMEHRRLIRDAIAAAGGEEMATEGDSFFVAFDRPAAAARAAVDAQLGLLRHRWPEGTGVRVRMGLHTGEAHPVSGSFVGLSVHRAARVAGSAHGGQILTSSVTAGLLADGLPDRVSLDRLGSYHLKDFDAPEELFQLSHPELERDFPLPRTEAVAPTNLPAQLTSFVGRDEMIRSVQELVGEARLITLTGAGGAGKTRLAQEVGARMIPAFPDGVWWVDLAPVADPALVAEEAARAMGLRESTATGSPGDGVPALDRIVTHLRLRQALIILDNCEHLLEACVTLAEALLRGCPESRLLATSREPLSVTGERTMRVPSLSFLDADAEPEEILTSEAVRLFSDRALAVRDDFDVEQELTAVAEISRRLDGIPLAIELAAARVRSLSCAEIAERLNDRFRLLTGGTRTALPRQRTLEALVDWSHDLLSEPERTLLRRLSVFSGGFTLQAAEVVCAGEGIDQLEVVDLLGALVDKSLVVADVEAGATRYRLLETIRQYSRGKLLAAGEVEAVRGGHLHHFLDLAQRCGAYVVEGPEQLRLLHLFEMEHDNFRTALEWATSVSGCAEEGVRLAADLGWFWFTRGHHVEARGWLARVLDRSEDILSPARAQCLAIAAMFDLGSFGRPPATARADEALSLARSLRGAEPDGYSETLALWVRGMAGRAAGEERSVFEGYFQEGLDVARDRGTRVAIDAALLHTLGIVAMQRGEDVEARRLFEASLAITREKDVRIGIVRALNTLAMLSRSDGDAGTARELWEESLRIARELGDKAAIASALGGLVASAGTSGSDAEARALAEELLVFARAWGEPSALVLAWNYLGYVHLAAGRWDLARDAFDEPLAMSHRIDDKALTANALHSLAELEEACGDLTSARRLLEDGIEIVRETTWSAGLALLSSTLGHVERRAGDTRRAQLLFSEALAISAPPGVVALSLEGCGLLAADEQAWETAARLLGGSEAGRTGDWARPPGRDADLEAALARGREAVGSRFDELYEEGRQMPTEEAIRVARDVTTRDH